MNLRIIEDIVRQFKRRLAAEREFPLLYAWESQRIFQEKWDPAAEDFGAMYEACLQNSTNRRLWKDQRYAPKEIMGLFIAAWPDFVRDMFADLFNESREVEGRMDRFIFHCDELLREYRELHPKFIETRHYHEDYRMVALYLAFRYPDQYALFDDEAFRRYMKTVQAKDPPIVADPGRSFKAMRVLYNQMAKDEELMELHYRRLDPGRHFMGKSLLLGWEAVNVVAN
jgi:hypothetical protein